jgi:hypothetical protein
MSPWFSDSARITTCRQVESPGAANCHARLSGRRHAPATPPRRAYRARAQNRAADGVRPQELPESAQQGCRRRCRLRGTTCVHRVSAAASKRAAQPARGRARATCSLGAGTAAALATTRSAPRGLCMAHTQSAQSAMHIRAHGRCERLGVRARTHTHLTVTHRLAVRACAPLTRRAPPRSAAVTANGARRSASAACVHGTSPCVADARRACVHATASCAQDAVRPAMLRAACLARLGRR